VLGHPLGLAGTPAILGGPSRLAANPTESPAIGQTIKETVAQSAQPAIQQDSVGRPRDARALALALARNTLGETIVRNEVLAVSPSEASLAIARQLNFTVARRDTLDALGISSATLTPPPGMSEADALSRLRQADPNGSYDYAHIYDPTGDAAATSTRARAPMPAVISVPAAPQMRIGVIDGGIAQSHRSFKNSNLVLHGFARNGEVPATAHGTAIASLLVGRDEDFSGFLPGATLYGADVFGGVADGGSADKIARALNWLAANKIAVTNISLAGPPNALLAAAVKAFVAGGHVLVAATGNDGPAAPPNYPAGYPGVVAVTSVDTQRHFQIDANRRNAAFAALGVDVRAANLPQGYGSYTGTSYAAPVVTARFVQLLNAPDAGESRAALVQVQKAAAPLNAGGQALGYLLPPGRIGTVSAALP
jgi:hypothetical protein